MPNFVYSVISFNNITKEQKHILKQIKEKGICGYYFPMPASLNITSGSAVGRAREILKNEFTPIPNNIEGLEEKYFEEARQSFINEKLYGAKDWYEWKNKYYGTKWGDFYLEINNNILTYSTAWAPLSLFIIEKLIQDFPDFIYEWEEEQGFGEQWECINKTISIIEHWNIPDVTEISFQGEPIYKLETPHRTLQIGYYSEYSPSKESFLGKTITEVKENLIH